MMFAIQTRSLTTCRRVALLGLIILVSVFVACGVGGSNATERDVVFTTISDGNTDIFRICCTLRHDSVMYGILDSLQMTASEGRDFSPAWSPKRDAIAFISERNGIPALWLMDIDGKSKRQLSGAGEHVTNFKWAPDSTRIVIEIRQEQSHWLGVLDLDSGEFSPATLHTDNVKIGSWSPDGEWVVYFSVEGNNPGIKRSNPNGVDEIQITTGSDSNPIWSPDGRSIAFNRVGESGAIDLIVTDIEGNEVTNLAPDEFDKTQFEWAPDSKHIVFVSESSGNAEIYTVNPDGKDIRQLTSNRVSDSDPRWSRDGASILFLSEGSGTFDIYSMDRNGEKQKRMTSISEVILESDW